MAYIGLAKPYIAKLVNEETKEYSDCFVAGGAIGMDISPEYNEASLYADNKLDDYRKDFKRATVKMNTSRIPVAGAKIMFGHEVIDNEVIYRTGDAANYCGVGFYVTESIKDKGDKYVAIIIYKTKFTESQEGFTTKGDNIEYKTPSVEGVASSVGDNIWKRTKVFDTEREAEEWVQTQLGYKKKCSTPVASVEPGKYTDAQTVTLSAGVGEQIYYTTNGITPTKDTGTLYDGAIAVTASLAIRAIAVKDDQVASDEMICEYIIGE